MTRGQYVALCVIGVVAALAFLEAQAVAARLRNVITPVPFGSTSGGIA